MNLLSSQPADPATLQWLIGHGYPLMFVAMIFEGPLVVMAASFAASMGHFNIAAVFGLAVAGDLAGDSIWFSAGYFGRIALLQRLHNRFAPSEAQMRKLEQLVARHPGKTLLAIKLSPIIPIPGLVAVGASRLSPAKFAIIVLLIIVPKSALFVVLGYFFGYTYSAVAHYLNRQVYAVAIVIFGALVVYLLYRKAGGRISKNMEG